MLLQYDHLLYQSYSTLSIIIILVFAWTSNSQIRTWNRCELYIKQKRPFIVSPSSIASICNSNVSVFPRPNSKGTDFTPSISPIRLVAAAKNPISCRMYLYIAYYCSCGANRIFARIPTLSSKVFRSLITENMICRILRYLFNILEDWCWWW